MKMRENYLALAEQARRRLRRGKDDIGVPEINHDHAKAATQVPDGQRRAR